MEDKNPKRKVLIALLTDSQIHNKVVGRLCQILNDDRYEINTLISQMAGIGEHRNVIVKDFLKSDYEYLIMVDSDNPPPANMLDLVELDKDIIGLPTPVNMNFIQGVADIRWNIFGDDDMLVKEAGQGLEEVKMIGTGAIIIRRNVLEAIENPFTTVRNEADLRVVGTDAAFCKKAREAGFKIYAHWDYKCSHFKEIDLLTLCTNY